MKSPGCKGRTIRNLFVLLLLLIMEIQVISQQVTIDSQVRMLALGDSYTIGESVDILERWPHQLIQELRKQGVDATDPDYIAETGWTTRRLLQGIRTRLNEDKDYNLVSLLIGVNNQYQRLDIASYDPDLRELIDIALSVANQDTGRVFIVSIPDYAFTPFGNGNPNISEEIDLYNAIKREVALEYGIAFADITPISRLGLQQPDLVAGDGLHPSGKQYSEWVETIFSLLKIKKPLSSEAESPPEVPDGSLQIVPNPASSGVWINAGNPVSDILIRDSRGVPVQRIRVDGLPFQLDLSELSPGMYLLEAKQAHTTQVHRLILK